VLRSEGDIQTDTLDAHNSRRQRHVNTPDFVWNDCLGNCTANFAALGQYAHNGNKSTRCSECGLAGDVGENVGTGFFSIEAVMEGFYDNEADHWNYHTNTSYGSNNTEHMAQVGSQ
jgi:hypothetical protein